MGSTRLPGKTLMTVGDRTILEWVIYRVRQANLGRIIVTTSVLVRDDPIAQLCYRIRVPCFRGDEQNVLDRFYRASVCNAADSVVRITADCPLLCPVLLSEMVGMFDRERVDYAGVIGAPEGLHQEVISGPALKSAWQLSTSTADREHVVTWTLSHPDLWPASFVRVPAVHARWSYALDTREDLWLIRRLYRNSRGRLFTLGNQQIMELTESDPRAVELAGG
jgi:spore coat polysaccharide biosynthesis protein SpsF (cytidylyltransferase family)